MHKHTISIISILLLIFLVGMLLVSCGGATSTPGTSSGGSDGKSLMDSRCSVCHSTGRVTSAHMTAAEWTTTVQTMVARGAQLNATEQQTLIDYLAANYK
jgi:predicted CxxxxCH...CXXCH cytochrome family protein